MCYLTLIQCSTQDEDKNAITLKFIVSCKNVGGLFPGHYNNIFMFLEGKSLPRQNGFDLSITGHFLEVHMSEDDETCLYCHCDVTRGQGVKWGVEFRY